MSDIETKLNEFKSIIDKIAQDFLPGKTCEYEIHSKNGIRGRWWRFVFKLYDDVLNQYIQCNIPGSYTELNYDTDEEAIEPRYANDFTVYERNGNQYKVVYEGSYDLAGILPELVSEESSPDNDLLKAAEHAIAALKIDLKLRSVLKSEVVKNILVD